MCARERLSLSLSLSLSLCVCMCARARTRVCVCVCVRMTLTATSLIQEEHALTVSKHNIQQLVEIVPPHSAPEILKIDHQCGQGVTSCLSPSGPGFVPGRVSFPGCFFPGFYLNFKTNVGKT